MAKPRAAITRVHEERDVATAWSDWRVFWVSLGAFVGVRVVSLVAMLPDRHDLREVLDARNHDLLDFLARHADGSHYLMVAAEGYGEPVDSSLMMSCDGLDERTRATFCPPFLGGQRFSNLAFFPLFPWLVRVAERAGADPRGAAVLLSVAASLVAAGLIGVLASRIDSAAVGILTACLWAAHPGALVLWLGRPESLFTALCAACLILLLGGRLWPAAALAALAGLLRFQAVALVASTLVTLVRDRRRRGVPTALLVAMASAAGVVLYLGFVAVRIDDPRGWFAIQESWNSRSDWGVGKLQFVSDAIAGPEPMAMASAWGLLVALVLLLAMAVMRLPTELLVFSAVLLAGLVVQGGFHEHILRFLLVIFPLLIPLAILLSRLPRVLAGVVVCSAALASGSLTSHVLISGLWWL